jgi:hypothetical protein
LDEKSRDQIRKERRRKREKTEIYVSCNLKDTTSI